MTGPPRFELPRVDVALEAVETDDPVQAALDEEIEAKYAGSPRSSIDAMLSAEAIACTFRVVPA